MTDLNLWEYFFCGGVGGICSVLIGHPFDTVKVLLQTAPVKENSMEAPKYKGSLDCVKKIVESEGIRGLYKGMSAPLMGVAPIFAVSFAGYNLGRRFFKRNQDRKDYLSCFESGAFSGAFTTVIMAPGERIKCLLQTQQVVALPPQSSSNVKYKGAIDCLWKLYGEGGIRSVYKGSTATLLRDVPSSGMYFLTYEFLCDLLRNEEDQRRNNANVFVTILAGGAAGISNWLVAMPFDVLKSRFQTAEAGGMRDILRTLLEMEGVKGFYKGIVPVLLRAFPANAACFLGFEFTREILAAIP